MSIDNLVGAPIRVPTRVTRKQTSRSASTGDQPKRGDPQARPDTSEHQVPANKQHQTPVEREDEGIVDEYA